MLPTIHIRELRPSAKEADEMDGLGLQAFTNVAVHRLMFPRGAETRTEEQRFRAAVEETVLADDSQTEAIVGWARWDTAPQASQSKTAEERDREMEDSMRAWPEVMDRQAYRRIPDGFAELDAQWLAGEDATGYWVPSIVAVHPDHQDKGLGTKADEMGDRRSR